MVEEQLIRQIEELSHGIGMWKVRIISWVMDLIRLGINGKFTKIAKAT